MTRDKLQHESPMPYGKYKGVAMKKIPADYLFYLWTHGLESQINTSDVADYISRNLKELRISHPDGIW